MEERQVARQDGAEASDSKGDERAPANNNGDKSNEPEELGEKMKKIDVKPPAGLLMPGPPAFPAKPQPVGRVKQLRDTALGQPSPSSSSSKSLQSSGSATGNPRNKTALAPGHSLMDWIRLGASGADLTGVGGRLLTVTPAELARHNKESDAWIAIRGIVFNITRYKDFHPGGVAELMKGAGKDGTKLFDDVHAWVNYQSILQKCVVGRLERCVVGPDLLFASEKSEPKKSRDSGEAKATESSGLQLDWRQTSNGVSLFFTPRKGDAEGGIGECQIARLNERELRLGVVLESSGEMVSHWLKLAEEVEWPPSCRKSPETQEVELLLRKKERGIWKSYGSQTVERQKKEPGKRTYNEYELLENAPLGKLVHLLVLRARNYVQLVPPGRHVEVKMNVMGTEVSRPYTPVPSCLRPELRPAKAADDCLCLMVKRYEDGALSKPLSELAAGSRLQISNAIGDFRPESYDDCTTLHLLAAGSGLTVMLPIIQRALSRRSSPSINLINFNKDEDNVFYARELDLVARESTLKVTHVLTTAGSSWQAGRQASLSKELLEELVGEYSPRACVFTCGPPGFMQAARECLRNLGWEQARLHEFDG